MALKNFVTRHAIWVYFALVYGLAWGGILLILPAFASPDAAASPLMIAAVSIPMLLSPGVVGITLTAWLEGGHGLKEMFSRMIHWRVAGRWYVVALLIMPLLVLTILYTLTSLVSPDFAPILSLMGLAGIAAGFFEEIGWTGFATPKLCARWRPFYAGLLLGILWGLWHGLADYAIRGTTLGAFWPVTFTLFVLPLTAWRILMVWVYDHTHSGPVAQLMHFSYTGSLALFIPLLSPTEDALIYGVLGVLLWLGVAVLAFRPRRMPQQTRPQPGIS